MLPGRARLWSGPPLQRLISLCCGAPVCQCSEVTSHPKGENIPSRHGCGADAVREEKPPGMVVEQLGSQLGAVDHPFSSLQTWQHFLPLFLFLDYFRSFFSPHCPQKRCVERETRCSHLENGFSFPKPSEKSEYVELGYVIV